MPTRWSEDLTYRTLADALRLAQLPLRTHGDEARRDAEVLLASVLGCARSHLYAHAEQTLTATQAAKFQTLIERRAAGEPVAYLLGTREFWSLELTVNADTLIPRPDTELLVERALHCIPKDAALRIADLGTGSGAIALAIARERPRCHVIATDISEAALVTARGNAARLGIDTIEFRSGDWCAALAGTRCAVIISNPPYIPAADPHLARGDVRFEPRAALTPGPEGLEAIRQIAAQAHAHLYSGGWLLLEHGYDQSDAVTGLLHDLGYREITASADLSGHQRVAEGRK
jgi:release factor glutamine methyltransferase